jgi:hypothetical protein
MIIAVLLTDIESMVSENREYNHTRYIELNLSGVILERTAMVRFYSLAYYRKSNIFLVSTKLPPAKAPLPACNL